MKNMKYEKIVQKNKAKETRVQNAIVAFISGGIVGALGEGIIQTLCHFFELSRSDASIFMSVILVFIASLCTALGFFDKLVAKLKLLFFTSLFGS